jgi:hypothetical protein
MPSGLQIYFRWKTCFIHAGNKDQINRTSSGWEIRTLYSCEFYERLKSWFVRFWCSHLPTFIPYFKSISIEKIAIFRLGICTLQIRTRLVKYYEYFTRVTFESLKKCAFILNVSIWYCYLCHSNRFQMTNLLCSSCE